MGRGVPSMGCRCCCCQQEARQLPKGQPPLTRNRKHAAAWRRALISDRSRTANAQPPAPGWAKPNHGPATAGWGTTTQQLPQRSCGQSRPAAAAPAAAAAASLPLLACAAVPKGCGDGGIPPPARLSAASHRPARCVLRPTKPATPPRRPNPPCQPLAAAAAAQPRRRTARGRPSRPPCGS